MARISTYVVLRQVHLYSVLILTVFLLVYFISGLFFRHYKLPVEGTELPADTLNLSIDPISSPEKVVIYLQDSLHLTGKRNYINRNDDGSFSTVISNPQKRHRISVPSNRKQVVIQTHISDLRSNIHYYHTVHIFGGGFKFDLYLVFLDLVSISMFVFVLSGVYMWFNLMRNKWWGILAIVLGLGYVSVVIFSMYN